MKVRYEIVLVKVIGLVEDFVLTVSARRHVTVSVSAKHSVSERLLVTVRVRVIESAVSGSPC